MGSVAMVDLPTPGEVGQATSWFTTQAGIVSTVLAFVCVALGIALVWERHNSRKSMDAAVAAANAAWIKAFTESSEAWGKRMDQFRTDVKEAFNQNDEIADKVVGALTDVKLEIARMSGRSERGRG